jgi:L-ascorbate metabolism protein UlaG (beta-lactamase superfamily)
MHYEKRPNPERRTNEKVNRSKMKWIAIIVCSLVNSNLPGQFRIDYFGNMGVAISRNDSVIFIDAFHSFYQKSFLETSPEKLTQVIKGSSPFTHGVAAMVTHYHRDHVDPKMLSKVLESYPQIKLICGDQVGEMMDTARQNVMSRIILVRDEIETRIGRNIYIKARKIWHTNYFVAERFAKTDNYYFLIEWGGRRFLHIGDAEAIERNFISLEKLKGTIDYLLAPSWFVYDSANVKLIDKLIQPKNIIVLHVNPGERTTSPLTKQPTTIFEKYDDFLITE